MDPTTKLTDQQAGRLAQLTLKQQVSAVEMERIARDMQLRQWCVEQANVFCEHNGPFETGPKGGEPYALDVTAKSIYDFVTAPLREQQ